MISILATTVVGLRVSAPRSARRSPGASPADGAAPADEDRTDGVLTWMFLRLRDVDTSLCFTAAAGGAMTTVMGTCRARSR